MNLNVKEIAQNFSWNQEFLTFQSTDERPNVKVKAKTTEKINVKFFFFKAQSTGTMIRIRISVSKTNWKAIKKKI